MIYGVGIDLVRVPRLAAILSRYGERFLQRVYTRAERTYCLACKDPIPRLAGRFK